MNRKTRYTEPEVPAGAAPFNNCSIEVSKLPLDLFLRVGDGRKFIVKCRHRKALPQALASHANQDGTSCYPSRETLQRDTGFSDGTIDVYLRDLESDELKFVVKGGYAWEGGLRVRRLIMPVVGVAGTQDSPDKQEAEFQDSDSGTRDSNSGTQDSGSGTQDSKAGTQSRLRTTRQYLDPPVDNPPVPYPPEQNGMDGRMAASVENLAGRRRIEDKTLDWFEDELKEVASICISEDTRAALQSKFDGASENELRQAFRNLLDRDKGWEGLRAPGTIILREFPSCLRKARREIEKREEQAKAERAAIEAAQAAAAEQHRRLLAEIAEEDEIAARVAANPDALFGG